MLTTLHRHPNHVSVEDQLGRFVEYTVISTFPTGDKVERPVGRQIWLVHSSTCEQLLEDIKKVI